jgi:signal transduction histidine kinase
MEYALPDSPLNILHLEDSIADHHLVCRALEKAGVQFSIRRVDCLDDFTHRAWDSSLDLVLADYRLPGFTALDAWSAMSQRKDRPPFILISGTIGESAAVGAIHLGISDYIHKDDLGRIERVIGRTLEVRQARAARDKASRELAESEQRLAEFAGHLQNVIEHERAAIAREIHDDIGGSLAAARLDLAWIGRHVAGEDTKAHIQAATEMLQHAIGASQRIMINLRPAILDQGLHAAIQWLASSFERRTGIKTLLRSNSDHYFVSKDVQLTAYRTTQEALTNASKYANCTLLSIDLSDAEDVLTVEVSDNGIGIAEHHMNKSTAFGLRGLQERAKTVGGWLDISTREGAGTTIILSVPLNDHERIASTEATP